MKLHDQQVEEAPEMVEASYPQEEMSASIHLGEDGLPSEQQIEAWKMMHGKIYKNIVDGETYIWRRVKRREYVDAMSLKSEENPDENVYIRQNAICMMVTLYPETATLMERIEEYAGLAGEISDRSILKSGFQASETEEL